jgi:alkanesulfonate monooxygenase SsuD/methylene tetrahydromethanopterin reductase-like flavin-dependent oxidoreductase (luciferase family)
VKVGVQLPEVERRVSWPELWAMARLIEDGGLDSIWVGEHLLYETSTGMRGPWEAYTLMAALAAVTERVQIGPLVSATSFHNPAMLAKQAATLDEISGGRLILGLGAGWNRTEFDAFGFPYDRRASRFEEAFTIVRTLLAEGFVDFHGEFYDLPRCTLDPLGPSKGGPPLLIGSTGPRVLAFTLPHVDMWNAWYTVYDNDPKQAPALLATIDQASLAVGRPPGEIAKSLSLLFHFEPEPVHRQSRNRIAERGAMIEALGALEDAGVHTVQLVLDPITLQTIEEVVDLVREWQSG